MISPKCFAFGPQPGQHGALDIVQSRARSPSPVGGAPRLDERRPPHRCAPTICRLMGFPYTDGILSASERGVAPDVYLKRQDGGCSRRSLLLLCP